MIVAVLVIFKRFLSFWCFYRY